MDVFIKVKGKFGLNNNKSRAFRHDLDSTFISPTLQHEQLKKKLNINYGCMNTYFVHGKLIAFI